MCEGGGSATPEYSRLIGDPPENVNKMNFKKKIRQITFFPNFPDILGFRAFFVTFVDIFKSRLRGGSATRYEHDKKMLFGVF